MSNIQIFNNDQFGKVRVIANKENGTMFCLADICKSIELTNPSSVKCRLDKEDIQLIDLHALNSNEGLIGNSMATFITEAGLYDILLFSSSKKVKPFRKWVTSEVLPSIRKHGAYMTNETLEKALTSPDFLIQLATNLKIEQQKRIEAEAKIQRQEKALLHKSEVIEGLVEDLSLAELRQRINQIVRFGRSKGFQERFRLLYQEFGLKYHMNLDRRFNSKKAEEMKIKSKMDYIDRVLGMIPELYDLACKLFETDVKRLIEKEWKLSI